MNDPTRDLAAVLYVADLMDWEPWTGEGVLDGRLGRWVSGSGAVLSVRVWSEARKEGRRTVRVWMVEVDAGDGWRRCRAGSGVLGSLWRSANRAEVVGSGAGPLVFGSVE